MLRVRNLTLIRWSNLPYRWLEQQKLERIERAYEVERTTTSSQRWLSYAVPLLRFFQKQPEMSTGGRVTRQTHWKRNISPLSPSNQRRSAYSFSVETVLGKARRLWRWWPTSSGSSEPSSTPPRLHKASGRIAWNSGVSAADHLASGEAPGQGTQWRCHKDIDEAGGYTGEVLRARPRLPQTKLRLSYDQPQPSPEPDENSTGWYR